LTPLPAKGTFAIDGFGSKPVLAAGDRLPGA